MLQTWDPELPLPIPGPCLMCCQCRSKIPHSPKQTPNLYSPERHPVASTARQAFVMQIGSAGSRPLTTSGAHSLAFAWQPDLDGDAKLERTTGCLAATILDQGLLLHLESHAFSSGRQISMLLKSGLSFTQSGKAHTHRTQYTALAKSVRR